MKKVFLGLGMIVGSFLLSNVVLNSECNSVSLLSLENIEALASCESSIETKRGQTASLTCTNSSNEKYTITACEFDNDYREACTGRQVND